MKKTTITLRVHKRRIRELLAELAWQKEETRRFMDIAVELNCELQILKNRWSIRLHHDGEAK
jgi:hypothetical protein